MSHNCYCHVSPNICDAFNELKAEVAALREELAALRLQVSRPVVIQQKEPERIRFEPPIKLELDEEPRRPGELWCKG